MIIDRITLLEISMPLKEPFAISSGAVQMRRILLLKIESTEGIITWSECVAGEEPNYSYETIDTAWLAIKLWIAPRIIGREFSDPREIDQILEKDFRGHNMAKAAVEMAAWEMETQRRGIPLAKLLGGTREKIATGISLGIQESPQLLAEKAAECLRQGYQRIKVKIKPGADVEFVREVRDHLSADGPLMVDANNAYSLDDLDALLKLDEFGLMMIEQPLAWDDLVWHAQLQKHLETPICLDESITGVDKAEGMLELGSGRIVNIKPGRVGGISPSLAIHDFCSDNDIPVWCGGMLESGIGRAYNVALASLPNFVLPGDVSPSSRYWERDIVAPEWKMDKDGMIAVPLDRAGMGVTVDEDFVNHLTVRTETLSRD